MYIGWMQPFRTERPLTQRERDSALPREHISTVQPSQKLALIKINSVYLDWIDRRSLFRGFFATLLATVVGISMAWIWFFYMALDLAIYMYFRHDPDSWMGIPPIVLTACLLAFFFRSFLFKEYFTYTYFPIRFNRKTRMVHVFRHNGAGGVLSVPWDKVFFHISEESKRKQLIDIRGEVLDGDIVKDTFALGHAVPKSSQRSLLEMWEFIRRYMEEGPETAGPHPLDRYVELSVEPSWKNCHLVTSTYYAADLPPFFQTLVSPLVLLFTLTRWVVLHTCRKPVFPPEIEATCKVDPDDPNVWPVPRSSGEFAATVPGLFEHAKGKALRSWQAEREQRGL